MSARPGTAGQFVSAGGATGGPSGRTFGPVNPNNAVVVPAITFIYTATAGVGNRIVIIQIKDSLANVIWQMAQGTAVTAGQSPRFAAGAGVAAQAIATPLMQYVPLPVELILPPSSTITVFDNANIDPADTVTAFYAAIAQ